MSSKVLVLSGTNFADNKIMTVTLEGSGSVPCTGIALSQSTATFNVLSGTVSLTATLTPANTTDTLSWSSSDNNVATVSNGVITSTGIGTATITAICGTQSATCAVTVTNIAAEVNYIVGQCAPATGYSATFDASLNRFTGVGSISDGSYADAEVVDTRTASPYYRKDIAAIPIPRGAAKVCCHQVGAPTYGFFKPAFYDGTTAGNATYPAMLVSIGNVALDLTSSDIDADIPAGATSLTFAIAAGGTYTVDQDANELAEALQLAITFK